MRDVALLEVDYRRFSIAFIRGSKIELDFMPVLRKSLLLWASTLRSQLVTRKAARAQELRDKVWLRIETGSIRPYIYATCPLDKVARAHTLMESGAHFGKIVLKV